MGVNHFVRTFETAEHAGMLFPPRLSVEQMDKFTTIIGNWLLDISKETEYKVTDQRYLDFVKQRLDEANQELLDANLPTLSVSVTNSGRVNGETRITFTSICCAKRKSIKDATAGDAPFIAWKQKDEFMRILNDIVGSACMSKHFEKEDFGDVLIQPQEVHPTDVVTGRTSFIKVRSMTLTINHFVDPTDYTHSEQNPALSSNLPELSDKEMRLTAEILIKNLSDFVARWMMVADGGSNFDILDGIKETIENITKDLEASNLYTFYFRGGYYKDTVVFDIYKISETNFGKPEHRMMISTFFWRQKDLLRKYLDEELPHGLLMDTTSPKRNPYKVRLDT